MTTSEFSRYLLHLHQARHLEDFWNQLLAVVEAAMPTHSVSLYFDYFAIQDGFWVLHQQLLPWCLRPWAERRRVSPTPTYLRAHVGKKTVATEELLSGASDDYFRLVMQAEGWRFLFCLTFWEGSKPTVMLVVRKSAKQKNFTRAETDFLESLYGHIGMILRRFKENRDVLLRDLSLCEKQVAFAALEGLSNKEIAQNLDKTEATVKAQLSSVFAKLKIKRRSQLAVRLNA